MGVFKLQGSEDFSEKGRLHCKIVNFLKNKVKGWKMGCTL